MKPDLQGKHQSNGWWDGRANKAAPLEISKNSEKVTMDVVIIYQADQEVAILHLQRWIVSTLLE